MRIVPLTREPPPADWGVEIDEGPLERVADDWARRSFQTPGWDYPGLPEDRGRWTDFCGMGCSVVACLWPPEGEPIWEVEHRGEWLSDAPALFACFARHGWEPSRFLGFTEAQARELFSGRGTFQLIPERAERLGRVAEAVGERWDGTFQHLVEEAGHGAPRVAELLVETVPGYRDEAETEAGLLRFHKLARLATAMMAAEVPLSHLEAFPVYPDYILPMVLRHLGILRYRPDLAEAVDTRRLIPHRSDRENAIRWATMYAAERLRRELEERGNPVTSPDLDFHLWSRGVLGPEAGRMGEHHRTVTLAY